MADRGVVRLGGRGMTTAQYVLVVVTVLSVIAAAAGWTLAAIHRAAGRHLRRRIGERENEVGQVRDELAKCRRELEAARAAGDLAGALRSAGIDALHAAVLPNVPRETAEDGGDIDIAVEPPTGGAGA